MPNIGSYPIPPSLDGSEKLAGWKDGAEVAIPVAQIVAKTAADSATILDEIDAAVDAALDELNDAGADVLDEARAARDAAVAAVAGVDLTSLNFSELLWPYLRKAIEPVLFVSRDLAASNVNAGTSEYAPKATIANAYAAQADGTGRLLLRTGQTHHLDRAATNGGQFGDVGLSGKPHPVSDYGGEGLHAPLIDARSDLSGLVWTNFSGAAWQCVTHVLPDDPLYSGIEQANGTKFALDLDYEDPALPGGVNFAWKTNGANVAANDAAVVATAGSYAVNLPGSTVGDIRTTGSTSRALRIVVHLPDGSNPNGKPLRLTDAPGVVGFQGGDHGHLAAIGGSGKDNVGFGVLPGATSLPTFQSFTSINMPVHAGVGPRNVLGTWTAHGRPSEGTSVAAQGRTFGAMLHLFDPFDHSLLDATIGAFDVAHGQLGVYAHGNGVPPGGGRCGLNALHVLRRSLATNCTTALGFDGGSVPGQGFFVDGVYLHGGVDIVGGVSAFGVSDEPNWLVNGGSWATDDIATTGLVSLSGSDNRVVINDFWFAATHYTSAATGYASRVLYNWSPYYGYSLGGALPPIPTLIFNHVEDRTVIDVSAEGAGSVRIKFGFYAAKADYPNASRAHLEVLGQSLLGDMWQGQVGWDTYPESLIVTDYCEIGFGGKTRTQVQTRMDALGLAHDISPLARFVDYRGNVVSGPAR